MGMNRLNINEELGDDKVVVGDGYIQIRAGMKGSFKIYRNCRWMDGWMDDGDWIDMYRRQLRVDYCRICVCIRSLTL